MYARASLGEYLDAQECIDITIQGMRYSRTNLDVPYPFRIRSDFVPEFNAERDGTPRLRDNPSMTATRLGPLALW